MGILSIIPTVLGPVLPGAPTVDTSAASLAIASLPGLRHVIDPATMAANAGGVCRFSGAQVSPATSTTREASNAAMNNKPVFNFSNGAGGLQLPPGTVTPSYTVLMAALLDTARYDDGAATSSLMAIRTAVSTDDYLWNITSARVLFLPRSSAGGNSLTATKPARGVKAIYGISFDGATKQSAQLFDQGAQVQLSTHTTGPVPDQTSRYLIGGFGAGNSGWVGKVGKVLIFDRALHLGQYAGFLAKAVAMLKTEYAIV